MLTILILTFFLLLNLMFLSRSEHRELRLAFVKSGITLFAVVAISTEVLSYFFLLKSDFIVAWWIFLNLAAIINLHFSKVFSLQNFYQSLKLRSAWISGFASQTIWIFFILIYLTVLITALFAPPNTADALSYHLPRVAHWTQTGSVEFYQTAIERQLFNPPLAEYFILQLQLLAGSDRFANLVQFFGFLSVGILTSLISQRFKADYFAQLLTVLISASLTMAILQASSSKNDLVASFFVVGFFYFLMKAFNDFKKEDFVFAGLALGLGILTKGNVYFYCLPIGVLFIGTAFWQKRGKLLNSKLLLFGMLIIAFAINFGHYFRTWQLYGTPVKGEERLKNEEITLQIVFANAVRNYAVHFGTKFGDVNDFTVKTVNNLLGEELNNAASTVDEQKFMVNQSYNEDYAGNILHIILLTFAIFFIFFAFKDEKRGEAIILTLSIIFGFLLFCAFLKWNYWVSRVHSPLFFLGSPLIALFIVRQLKNISNLTVFLFFFSAVFTIYVAKPRSLIPYEDRCVYLVPRAELYYSNNQNLHPLIPNAMQFLKEKHPTEIGLDLSTDTINYNFGDWEYVFWVELKTNFVDKPIFRHVNVENPSNKYKPQTELPEWIISTKKGNMIENVEYSEAWAKGHIRILQRKY